MWFPYVNWPFNKNNTLLKTVFILTATVKNKTLLKTVFILTESEKPLRFMWKKNPTFFILMEKFKKLQREWGNLREPGGSRRRQ